MSPLCVTEILKIPLPLLLLPQAYLIISCKVQGKRLPLSLTSKSELTRHRGPELKAQVDVVAANQQEAGVDEEKRVGQEGCQHAHEWEEFSQ